MLPCVARERGGRRSSGTLPYAVIVRLAFVTLAKSSPVTDSDCDLCCAKGVTVPDMLLSAPTELSK